MVNEIKLAVGDANPTAREGRFLVQDEERVFNNARLDRPQK